MESPVRFIQPARVPKGKQGQSTQQDTEANNMKEPKLNTEFGWCVFKYMFMLLIFTNLLWAGIYTYTLHKASSDTITTTEMWQDGSNNKQSITNG